MSADEAVKYGLIDKILYKRWYSLYFGLKRGFSFIITNWVKVIQEMKTFIKEFIGKLSVFLLEIYFTFCMWGIGGLLWL